MRLIDADALKDFINRQLAMTASTAVVMNAKDFFENIVDNAPTIEPKKHGEWLKIDDCDTVQCSVCFEDFDYIDGLCYLCHGQELPNYCPNCGARMERSEE